MASPLFRPSAAAISPVEIIVDGRRLQATSGQMLAAALLTGAGGRVAPLCLMGSCFQCLVTVDGRANQRACRIRVVAGMKVKT